MFQSEIKTWHSLRERGIQFASASYAMSQLSGYSILVAGPARVGKSTLINSLVGRETARTSPSLNACTKDIREYRVRGEAQTSTGEVVQRKISFWDTPGIENWTDRKEFANLTAYFVANSSPICALLCFSPGCNSKTSWMQDFASALRAQGIFVCFVVTNMYAGSDEQSEAAFSELVAIATKIFNEKPRLRTAADGDLFYAGFQQGLVVKVNSKEFVSRRGNVHMPPQHLDDLAHGIIEGLQGNDEKLLHWCLTILDNRTLLQKLAHGWADFVHLFKRFFGLTF